MRSILVSGGSGFFGRGFVRRALDLGAERICVFSRGEYAQHLMRQAFGNDPRLRWLIGDVRDRDRLRKAMQGVELVVHAAALKRVETGVENPTEMKKTNVDGTQNVIEAATDAGVKKVIYLSTDKAYQPCSPYGLSKAMAEAHVLAANNERGAHGPRFAACRYGNVWGSTGSVVPMWQQLLATGATAVPVTDPECTRFYMTRAEAAQLVIDLAASMQGGELVIPDLPAYRLGDLATAMGARMDVRGLPGTEKLHESMSADRCSADARRMSVFEIAEALNHA
jgi:UDP-N-acetylglucosamine 4,6-dehydratase